MANSFENELMFGMQKELHSHDKKAGMKDLLKAVGYLQAAMEICEEAGLTKRADQILRILGKIASESDQIKLDKEFYEKMMKWLANPETPVDTDHVQPGEEISFTSLLEPEKDEKEELSFTSLLNKNMKPSPNDLVFESIATELGLVDQLDARTKPHRPKNPTAISNRHNKKLSPEQMLRNLADHGTMLADDGSSDLLNLEIIDEPSMSDEDSEDTFEDGD